MRLDDDWTNRQRKIEAARGRLTASERRREDRKAGAKQQQNYDDLQRLKRLDDRRDKKGRRS